MDINNDKIEDDFLSDLLFYIDKERIKMKLSNKSDSELKFESPDHSIIIKFIIDNINHKLLYDVYLSEYHKHLKEKTIVDFEKMYSLMGKYGKMQLPKYLPDVWMILDEIHIWARKTNFTIKGKIIT